MGSSFFKREVESFDYELGKWVSLGTQIVVRSQRGWFLKDIDRSIDPAGTVESHSIDGYRFVERTGRGR